MKKRLHADMAELADATDLKSGAARREGSIPSIRTKKEEDIMKYKSRLLTMICIYATYYKTLWKRFKAGKTWQFIESLPNSLCRLFM